ncbi:Transposase IS200 like protein [Posidoniimonas polymericola]|uniref:Transposase IS200 like protein n=1 Tax=Posidoniimonas polymericola TaxID=2528002 RepID=A0A5C5YLY9_9BACT|nr:transposase [Posidoniimonas polymericola]TWT75866.1 Transposase IS200 like protein [Posidoniimonas polymericola]
MGRPTRAALGGYIYHVLNRANARKTIFEADQDYEAFEQVLAEAVDRAEMRLLAYCVMPNHWHLVLWPREDGDLSRFTGWLTLTHTQRWHAHRKTVGSGHVYQGRFKSFPVEDDAHFLTVCRYVERNPLRANLVRSADRWRWDSLWRWRHGDAEQQRLLSAWPVRRSPGWLEHVNRPLNEPELTAIRRSVARGAPYGGPEWSEQAIDELALESTVRPRGRPRKGS